jgi:hypothetical protein
VRFHCHSHSTDADCYHTLEYNVTLSAPDSSARIDRKDPVPQGHHVPADGEEMVMAEEALLKDPQFKKVIADLQLPSHATVVADSWIYG